MRHARGVPIQEIAQAVGVSPSTVSRALNGSDKISVATKQAVRKAMEEIAKQRGIVAAPQRPVLGLTYSHLAAGPDSDDPNSLFDQVLRGVEIGCRHHGYIPYSWQHSRLLTMSEGQPFYDAVSGVILVGGLIDHSLINQCQQRNLPVITIAGYVADRPVPSVSADFQYGTYIATEHLAKLGHTRIGFVNGPRQTYTSREKQAGYVNALVDAGFPIDPQLIVAGTGQAGFLSATGTLATEQLLALPNPPSAILYGTDDLAQGGYRAAQRQGIRIPHDLSVIGFHDYAIARQLHPLLSTVQVDHTLWGQIAVERLVSMLNGAAAQNVRSLIPVKLVDRESTGPRN